MTRRTAESWTISAGTHTTTGFLPWNSDKAGTLARMTAEVDAYSRLLDSGDICWFTVP